MGSRVPDYQGMFLRGYGGNAAALGVQQGDAIRNISGYTGNVQYLKPNISGWPTPSFNAYGAFYNDRAYANMETNYWAGGKSVNAAIRDVLFDVSRQVPTANENRPINKSVRYLIRAKS